MTNLTVDISPASRELLGELSEKTGEPISEVLNKALVAYRRDVFFAAMNAGYAELRADATAWAEHEAEREAWDVAMLDGLDTREHWTEAQSENPSG